MVKSIVTKEGEAEEEKTKGQTPPSIPEGGSGQRARSADSINGWANNEIIIGETEEFLHVLLEDIRDGRRVNLKGTRVTSLDRFNPK